jgi:hypothetical protein
MEFDKTEEFLVDLFLCTQLEEVWWNKLAAHFGLLVQSARKNLIIQWDTGGVAAGRTYVQISPEEESLYLEAVSSQYLATPLPADSRHSLVELGWIPPEILDDCPNYSRRFEVYELDYTFIGKFIMETFRSGYGCLLSQSIEIGPKWLDDRYPLTWDVSL